MSREYYEIARRAMASRRSFNKVFGIGCHKTGTTTLADVFKLCGLALADQAEGELTSHDARRGRYEKLIAYVQRYDAFQDSPFAEARVFIALDALFPDSKFILTVRESEAWFRSFSQFTAKRYGLPADGKITQAHLEADPYLFPGYVPEVHQAIYLSSPPDYSHAPGTDQGLPVHWDRLFDKAHYIDLYETRNREIRDYFKLRPHQLLEVDLTGETTIGQVSNFLGLPADFAEMPMPHLNKT
jgi:hypothetical protein